MPDRVVDGSIIPLIRIYREFPFKYCPQASSGFYDIQFDVIPAQDIINYCPQVRPYYLPIQQVTLADGYCPIEVEALGFVIIEKTTLADNYCLLTPPGGAGFIPVPKILLADGYCEIIILNFDPVVTLVKTTIVEGYCTLTIPIELGNVDRTTLAEGYCSLGSFQNNFDIVEKTTLADNYCSLELFI